MFRHAPDRTRIDRRKVLEGIAAAAAVPSLLASLPAPAVGGEATGGVVPWPAWSRLFADAGTAGVVALATVGEQSAVRVSDPDRAARAFRPASTFKIVNALIGLDAGLVGPDETFAWDGTERGINGKPWPAWNKSQTLTEAFRNSTVWVFQELARRIGPELMARRVAEFGYGNADIGGAAVDQFWLSGNLRISALEEIAFLSRLWSGALPVSREARDALRDIMRAETTGRGTLYGKTGWALDQRIGWYVGVIESGGKAHAFALNLDMDADGKLAPQRIAIAKAVAAELGYL